MHSESWIAQIRSLRPRAQQIFQELMQRSEPVTTEELARRYQRSDRSIRYDLEALATACEAMPVRLVHRRSGVWLEDTPEAKLTLRHQWSAVQGTVQMAAADRRLHRLLAVLLTTPEPIVVKQVQDWLEASLRTIYADMDRADLWLASHGLRLIRKPHYGAKVEGDELIRRQAAFRLLLAACGWTASNDAGNEGQRLLDIVRQHVDPFVKRRLLEESDLLAMARALRWNPASEMRFGSWWAKVALYGAVTCQRIRLGYPVDLFKPNVNALRETTEFSFAVQVAERLEQMLSLTWSEEEVIALALHMLGAYPNLHLEGSAQNTANLDDFSRNWVSRMLAAVDDALGMRLGADEELFRGLAFHVKPMIHRWLLGISIENDLLDEIREDHALAYYAAVVAAQFLERVFGQPLAAAEVGYMALHFGAALERRWARPKGAVGTVRALVVCAGGIGTGKILQSRIGASVTNLQVVDVLDQSRVHQAPTRSVDVIVSTVELHDAPVPHIVVNPLLPTEDERRLQRWVTEVTGGPEGVGGAAAALAEPMFQLIQQTCQVGDERAVREEIQRMLRRVAPYLTVPSPPVESVRKKVLRMLDVLTEECVQVRARAERPDDVVDLAGRLLVDAGAVEPGYVSAMKSSLAINGPYMVIVPGIAILHARPEDGVHRVCMSLVTLEQGVSFGHPDNDPVDIAIAFGAIDHEAHLQALSDLMRLLADAEALTAIRQAQSTGRVLDIIRRVTA